MTKPALWRSPVDPERVMQAEVQHWQEQIAYQRPELLAVEEPLEVRIGGQSLAIIMRTPGHDRELAAGFLLSEGIIRTTEDILTIGYALDDDGLPLPNVIDVLLCQHSPVEQSCDLPVQATFERRFAVSSSCGLCGKNSIADLFQLTSPLSPETKSIPALTLYTLSAHLREHQTIFSHTGGLHAAALFTLTGGMLLLREDVGRHNAVDKLIGHALLEHGFPYDNHILLVSGRTSFEILQKALIARIPCVAAISAPSSLAVELADTGGITLVGFLRDRSMNVYTHAERLRV